MTEKYRHWCFTLNNYSETDIEKLSVLPPGSRHLIYGKEVGESGTPHLQGFITFTSPRRVASLHEYFENKAHISVARDPLAAYEYCKKEGDFFELGESPVARRKRQGQRTDLHCIVDAIDSGETDAKKLRRSFPEVCAKYPNFVKQCIRDNLPPPILEMFPLRPWQQHLCDILKQAPDDRRIIFVVDPDGNQGKSWFCRYFEQAYGNTILSCPGKKADMIYAFINQLRPQSRVLFIDAPRSKQGEFIQYDYLEEIKNGFVCNTKYESENVYFQKLHVVVMMNELPDESKLSSDRFFLIPTKDY